MKKMVRFIKKTVAKMAVMASVFTVFSDYNVLAVETVDMVLNEGVYINSTDVESLKFVPQVDGEYCFFSVSEENSDVYAELYEGDSCMATSDDDGINVNFYIEAYLEAGKEYSLEVSHVSGQGNEYSADVYVMEKERIYNTPIQVVLEEEYYVQEGDYLEVCPMYYFADGTTMDSVAESMTVKWFRETSEGKEDLECTDLIYVFEEVKASDISEGEIEFTVEVYSNGELYTKASTSLYDKYKKIYGVENTYYVSEGAEILLEPEFYDPYDERISLDNERFDFEWYYYNGEENILLDGTDSHYDIIVQKEDFSSLYDKYYYCDLYVDGVYVATAEIYIDDEATYFYSGHINEKYATLGDELTLSPKVYNLRDEELDITSDDFVVTWYKIDAEGGETLLSTGPSYTITSVAQDDFYDDLNGIYNCYYCEICYKDVKYDYAEFYIADKDNSYYSRFDYAYVEIGDTITLKPIMEDWNYNTVELIGEQYSYVWYKGMASEEDKYLVGEDATITVELITEEDYGMAYYCYIYKNGEYIGESVYCIVETSKCIRAMGGEYSVKLGDMITLAPKVVDYYGNETDDVIIFCQWEKISNGIRDFVSEELEYTIDSISVNDLAPENSYICHFTLEGSPRIFTARFYLNESEEQITKEPVTNKEQTTKPAETSIVPTSKPAESTTTLANNDKVKAPAMAKIKKVTSKKKASKVVKFSIKKVKGAKGYQVQISKAKKFAKKNLLVKKFVKKANVSIKNKKLANKKKLYVKVRAYVLDAKGNKVFGKWSKAKRVNIK